MANFTKEDLNKLANLACLKVPDQSLAENLTQITKFIEQIDSVNTDNIEPMLNALDMTQKLRPDVVTEHNNREKFLKNAPKSEAGLFLVPKVIE